MEWRSRFEREARNWISLGVHENIVHALSFIRCDKPILILEFVEGQDLDRFVKNEPGGMALLQALEFGIQIARGLAHAHTCAMPRGSGGLIHRDLKPSNVLVTKQCSVKLTDFGLSIARGDTHWTRGYLGTIAYTPPEQFKDSHSVTKKADIYACGVLLYEMVTGNLPFPLCEERMMIDRIFNGDPESISTFREDVDPPLVDLINRCMMKDPGNRPETADELLAALCRIRKGLSPETGLHPPCVKCGYLGKKEHVICPICDVAYPSRSSGREGETWRCDCGCEVPSSFWYCLSCGQPSTLPRGARVTTKMRSGVFADCHVRRGIQGQRKRCTNCHCESPQTHIYCCHCGSHLTTGPQDFK